MNNDKYLYLMGYNQFFSDLATECDLYAFTVVFKSGGHKSGRARFEDEYNRKVLNRIRKRVDPKGRYGSNPIVFENFSIYEYDTCSTTRQVRSHKVHHVHALIPIRKCQSYRVWNKQLSIVDPKLQDALDAMKKGTVSSWLLEPAQEGQLAKWIMYMNKSVDSFQYQTSVVQKVDNYQFINKIAESIRTDTL